MEWHWRHLSTYLGFMWFVGAGKSHCSEKAVTLWSGALKGELLLRGKNGKALTSHLYESASFIWMGELLVGVSSVA
jgi:hypothetical protein